MAQIIRMMENQLEDDKSRGRWVYVTVLSKLEWLEVGFLAYYTTSMKGLHGENIDNHSVFYMQQVDSRACCPS